MITTEQLQKIKERCEKATPAPWTYQEAEGYCSEIACLYLYPSQYGNSGCCQKCENWAWYQPAFLNEPSVIDNGEYDGLSDENAEFIINARADIPLLLAEVERLQKEISDREQASFDEHAETHQWRDKAKALERALKSRLSACSTCCKKPKEEGLYCRELYDCVNEKFSYPLWEFDEARFTENKNN